MIFVTSGSSLPFDRLIRTIDQSVADGIISEDVFGQIGRGRYEPQNFSFARFLAKEEFDSRIRAASLVIGHAGIGTIVQSLESGTPLLVLPRRKEFGEVVNDHQVITAQKFEELGHIVSFEPETLAAQLERVRLLRPKARRTDPERVAERINRFLHELMERQE
jgi:beta-1,4-N-acetylglucosaminyltransferase